MIILLVKLRSSSSIASNLITMLKIDRNLSALFAFLKGKDRLCSVSRMCRVSNCFQLTVIIDAVYSSGPRQV